MDLNKFLAPFGFLFQIENPRCTIFPIVQFFPLFTKNFNIKHLWHKHNPAQVCFSFPLTVPVSRSPPALEQNALPANWSSPGRRAASHRTRKWAWPALWSTACWRPLDSPSSAKQPEAQPPSLWTVGERKPRSSFTGYDRGF